MRTNDSVSKIFFKRMVFVATTLVLVNAQHAFGQGHGQQQFKTSTGAPAPKPDRSRWASRDNGNLDYEPLRDKVDLPNLPAFTGRAKFVSGSVHQSERGPSYAMRFNAKEDPKLVLDWYKNTLNMYQWKITFADAQTVVANLKGSKCTVIVNDITGRKDGSQSEIEIDYFEQTR